MLRDSSWKISFSGAHYQDLSLPCSMKFDERVPLHSSVACAWGVCVGGGGHIEEMGKCPPPPPPPPLEKVGFLINKQTCRGAHQCQGQ